MQQLDLFRNTDRDSSPSRAPLAERMRPERLEDFAGQPHLLQPGKILSRLLHNQQLQSIILWGPPGCGKTTLAGIIAAHTDTHLVALSAVTAGTKEIRAAVSEAQTVWAREHRRTWLFMDEIHRLNKAQQDTLLPHVENGSILLLGATTENPSFEVIRPLLSRVQVLVLESLSDSEMSKVLHRALKDEQKGLGRTPATITNEAETYLIAASGGDARILLNALEVAVLTTPPSEDGLRRIDLENMLESLQRQAVHYDKGGEEHYNLTSALHKSIRGSDPDAGLYWLARMLDAGEDPLYIARRLVRMAVEDIGLADPQALVQATNALSAYQFLGSPEGDLALAQVVVYLSLAPKSNTVYTALKAANHTAKRTGSAPVPYHLRNAPTPLMKELGYSRNYQYPHDDPRGWLPDEYLPESLAGTVFYEPTTRGWEGKFKGLLSHRRQQAAKRKKPSQP